MTQEPKKSHDFDEIMAVFRRRVWLLASFVLGVLAVIAVYNEVVPPLYVTEFSVIYEDLIQPIPKVDYFQTTQRRETVLSNQIEEINSRQFFQEVARALPAELLAKMKLPNDLQASAADEKYLASFIRKNSTVAEPENNSNVIRITYADQHPEVTFRIAETMARVLGDRAIEQRKQTISHARQLIEDQLGFYKNQLDSAEKQLRDFKETNNISSLDQETEELLRQMTEAEVLLTTAKAQQQATEKRLKYIHEKMASEQHALQPDAVVTISSRLEKLKNKLVDLELQRTDLLMKGYSNQHPKLVKLGEDIDQTRESLASETEELIQKGKFVDPLSQLKDFFKESITLEANLEAYQAQVQTLNRILQEYEKKIRLLPDLELQLARLVRTVNSSDKIYTMLLEERERTRIVEAQNRGNLRLIDPPELPTTPVRPRKKVNLMIGFLIGSIIGSIMAFVIESLDTSIRTPKDLQRVTDLSVLGTIPKFKANVNGNLDHIPRDQRPSSAEVNQLITLYDGNSRAAEAFRLLRTNLQFESGDFRSNIIMVTSPQPGEGKSTTAINLAITTAQLGYQTLLIDADLRQPVLHRVFNQERQPGLSDILQSEAFQQLERDQFSLQKKRHRDDSQSNALQTIGNILDGLFSSNSGATQQPNSERLSALEAEIERHILRLEAIEHLSLLTSGAPVDNSSAMLGSRLMRVLLSLVKSKYDIVFIDSAPVLVVSDTAILGPQVDGVLVVCTSGRTNQRAVAQALALLEKGSTKILGLVLNKCLEEAVPRSYRRYYKSKT